MRDFITLKNAPTGSFKIDCLTGSHCQKLREFGFCEGLNITKLKEGSSIVCNVCDAKYAISKDLSSCVVLNENQSQDHDQPSSEE